MPFLLKRVGKRWLIAVTVIYLIILVISAYFAWVKAYYTKKSYELERQKHQQHE